MRYTHVLFDLDDTLFDFMAGSRLALHGCAETLGADPDEMWQIYVEVNDRWWARHREGHVGFEALRTGRMRETLAAMGIDGHCPDGMAESYLVGLGQQCHPLPGAEALVAQLTAARRRVGGVTNGLACVQTPRFEGWHLAGHFDFLYIAEVEGRPKPDPFMIHKALAHWSAPSSAVVLVGDSEAADGEAARRAGVDFVLLGAPTGAVPVAHAAPDLSGVGAFLGL